MFPLPPIRTRLLAGALVFVCCAASCESGADGRARVLRRGVPLSFVQESARAAEDTLPAEAGSQAYEQFCRQPGYPRTLRTWTDTALMRSKGAALVHIRLSTQRGVLLLNGRVAMDFPVSTGKNGSTPTGRYHIVEKEVRHRSNIYHVSMPYFMRLTYDGIGLHVGDVYRVPVSHGCIRLTREACIPLFRRLPLGTPVLITAS